MPGRHANRPLRWAIFEWFGAVQGDTLYPSTRRLAAASLVLLVSMPAKAQVPPFFDGGGGVFDPEIGVVQSGVILDAQAVVSADRKYVTMTTRFQDAQLLNLREFAFQT